MKAVKKTVTSKSKSGKNARTGGRAEETAGKVPRADGPDKRRPEVGADEIYGDTKIPATHRK